MFVWCIPPGLYIYKVKAKCSRYRPGGPREWVVVYVQLYSSMTATLEGGEWSAARPGRALPPGKTRYAFYRRLGGPQGRFGRAENLVPTGIRSRTVLQPVVSRYNKMHIYIYIYIYKIVVNVGFWFINLYQKHSHQHKRTVNIVEQLSVLSKLQEASYHLQRSMRREVR